MFMSYTPLSVKAPPPQQFWHVHQPYPSNARLSSRWLRHTLSQRSRLLHTCATSCRWETRPTADFMADDDDSKPVVYASARPERMRRAKSVSTGLSSRKANIC